MVDVWTVLGHAVLQEFAWVHWYFEMICLPWFYIFLFPSAIMSLSRLQNNSICSAKSPNFGIPDENIHFVRFCSAVSYYLLFAVTSLITSNLGHVNKSPSLNQKLDICGRKLIWMKDCCQILPSRARKVHPCKHKSNFALSQTNCFTALIH